MGAGEEEEVEQETQDEEEDEDEDDEEGRTRRMIRRSRRRSRSTNLSCRVTWRRRGVRRVRHRRRAGRLIGRTSTNRSIDQGNPNYLIQTARRHSFTASVSPASSCSPPRPLPGSTRWLFTAYLRSSLSLSTSYPTSTDQPLHARPPSPRQPWCHLSLSIQPTSPYSRRQTLSTCSTDLTPFLRCCLYSQYAHTLSQPCLQGVHCITL